MPIFIAISAICAVLLSSSFVLQINQGAWAGTFPGENGQIAFTSTRDGNREIYVMNADGSEQTRLTDNTEIDLFPSWSADGTKIAFTSTRDGNREIYVMNADGSEQTNISNNPAADLDPSWSPDGTKIAFVRGSDSSLQGAEREIFIMNADNGSDQRRFTHNSARDDAPSWSPDGTKIAFESDRFGTNAKIHVMNAADGSNVTRVMPDSVFTHLLDSSPSWSPDGTKIAFASITSENEAELYDIFIMNADDGSNVTKLTDGGFADTQSSPSWSPDGTKIAFTNGDALSTLEIFIMNADDGSLDSILTSNDAGDFSSDWGTNTSPAGGGNGDTTPPIITVPENITEEATSPDGAQVTYTVTAQDNVDGTATLEEYGTTVTQDDIGGDIDISCEPASGTTFPIGDTTVECSATDEAGNEGTASFTVTVNPPPSPFTPAQEAIDELISIIENLDDNVPQDVKASLIAVLNEVLNILNDNNPDNDESVCRTLDAFINQVNANERSDTLTADEADELSTQSEDIRNALNC